MSVLKRLAMVAVVLACGSTAEAASKDEAFAIDQVMGRADAPITIIEYASTTCGHCATLARETMPKVKAEWIETGKAKLIFRDFPTSPGPLSVGASMIAHCAGPMRYFSVLGMLFSNQDRWMGAERPIDAIKQMIRIAGISGDEVDACLKRTDLQQQIMDRATHGNKDMGVQYTPTLIINGKKAIEGAASYEEVDKALKAAQK